MQLNIGSHKATVLEKGVYYFALQNYPKISSLELKNIIDFLKYEKLYERKTEIVCENNDILDEINHALMNPKTVNAVSLPDNYVYHASSLKATQKILKSGKLLSSVKVYRKTGWQLAHEKCDSPWNDPPDYFEYIMFGWGNDAVGDYVVISDIAVGEQAEEEFKKGLYTGVRFYFKYEDIIKHPGAAFDGYHAIKVKDEMELDEYLYACIIPEQYKEELMPFIPQCLKNRTFFVVQNGLGMQAWSEKVHSFIVNLPY